MGKSLNEEEGGSKSRIRNLPKKVAGFMATKTFPLGRVQEAFETVFDRRDDVIKAMISIA